jgi:cytochrome c biogenesis protein CcmG/thiol:disulfide interchange protein DsbE
VTRRRTVRLTALAALVLVAGLVALLVTRPVAQGAQVVDSPLLHTEAPSFVARTAAGGRVDLASLRGRVVVLSFFASWCAPCREEAPDLAAFAWREHVEHQRTTVLGIVFNDQLSSAASFVAVYGAGRYPVVDDANGDIANAYAVTGPPDTVVIGPDGRIDAVLLGPATESQLLSITAQAARERA